MKINNLDGFRNAISHKNYLNHRLITGSSPRFTRRSLPITPEELQSEGCSPLELALLDLLYF